VKEAQAPTGELGKSDRLVESAIRSLAAIDGTRMRSYMAVPDVVTMSVF
jgi:hypothetical protein